MKEGRKEGLSLHAYRVVAPCIAAALALLHLSTCSNLLLPSYTHLIAKAQGMHRCRYTQGVEPRVPGDHQGASGAGRFEHLHNEIQIAQ